MAFKTVNKVAKGGALKAEQLKGTTGFLVGIKRNVGKHKSNIFILEDKKTGQNVEVWGNGSINAALTEDGKGMKLAPEYIGRLVRLTYAGKKKIKGRSQPMKEITVEVDTDTRKGGGSGKEYRLRK